MTLLAGAVTYKSKINYSLILNVISVCKSEDSNVVFGLIKNYQSNFSKAETDLINRMIDCCINYFRDFIQPNLNFKIPKCSNFKNFKLKF